MRVSRIIAPTQLNRDFLTEVRLGNVPGYSVVRQFGRNDAVPNGTWEFVNELGFTAWPLSAATTVRIKAGGDAADTAAGNGARAVTVVGLDGTGAVVSETIATAGASASSATSASFVRVYLAYVSSVGVYGAANTAAITIENGAGGTDILQIGAGEGESEFGGYTIPLAKTGYLLGASFTVDSTQAVDFRIFTRTDILDTSAPMGPKRLRGFWNGISGAFAYRPDTLSDGLAALTDVWVEARGDGGASAASADLEFLLVDD